MSATLAATVLILVSAFLHACVNAVVKASEDGLTVRGSMNAVALAVALPLTLLVPPPSSELWTLLAVSVLVHGLYPFFLVATYQRSDFTVVFPLARGVAPLGVAAISLAAGDAATGAATLLGIALVSCGVASLAREGGRMRLAATRSGVPLAVVTGMIVSCYTVIDALGVKLAATPYTYVVWILVLDGAFVSCAVALTRRGAIPAYLRANWRQALVAAALGIASYSIGLLALALGPLAQIAAMKETTVIFGVVIGVLILKEPPRATRLAAAGVVMAGVAVMRFG
jgi:drug/metabolite transporter (DMT)-like permease